MEAVKGQGKSLSRTWKGQTDRHPEWLAFGAFSSRPVIRICVHSFKCGDTTILDHLD